MGMAQFRQGSVGSEVASGNSALVPLLRKDVYRALSVA